MSLLVELVDDFVLGVVFRLDAVLIPWHLAVQVGRRLDCVELLRQVAVHRILVRGHRVVLDRLVVALEEPPVQLSLLHLVVLARVGEVKLVLMRPRLVQLVARNLAWRIGVGIIALSG